MCKGPHHRNVEVKPRLLYHFSKSKQKGTTQLLDQPPRLRQNSSPRPKAKKKKCFNSNRRTPRRDHRTRAGDLHDPQACADSYIYAKRKLQSTKKKGKKKPRGTKRKRPKKKPAYGSSGTSPCHRQLRSLIKRSNGRGERQDGKLCASSRRPPSALWWTPSRRGSVFRPRVRPRVRGDAGAFLWALNAWHESGRRSKERGREGTLR